MNEKCKCGISADIKVGNIYQCRRCYDKPTIPKVKKLNRLQKELFKTLVNYTNISDIHMTVDNNNVLEMVCLDADSVEWMYCIWSNGIIEKY